METSNKDIPVTDIVRHHAAATPNAPALIAEGQDPLTYGELVILMDKVQQRVNDAGFGRGDRIAIVGPNDAAMAALIMGIWGCAAAVPMNPAYTVGEFAIYLRDLKIQAVAVAADMDTQARAAARQIGLPILEVDRIAGQMAGKFDIRPVSDPDRAARPGPARIDDLALVLSTSGTTTHSKTVPLSHRQLLKKLELNAGPLDLTAADRCLNPMPLFHASGLLVSLGTTLYSGGAMITLPEYSTPAFLRLLETQQPTWYTGSYTFHHMIAAAAESHAASFEKSRLRAIRTGSGHLDERVADKLEDIFDAPVVETYSTTETGLICSNPLPPAVAKRASAGIVVCEGVAVMGPDNELLGPGQRGEVVVRCSETFSGYENDPVANAAAFVDGWFRTGDEGHFDDDGYLTLTGRIKDIINRGGEKITPSEVDEAIMSHPDVAAAVTFPVPHPTLGQEVAAVVVPARGAVLTEDALADYLAGKLASFKLPRKIVLVDKIPESAAGKFPRRLMAETLGLAAGAPPGGKETDKDGTATPLEAKLLHLWEEALSLPKVGLHDDFFMLGGDSLQAVDLFLRIEQELGRRLPRSVLFEAGTVAKMAEHIEALSPSPCLVPIQPKGDRIPFFCIHDRNGEVLNYRDLARGLGEAQPFYGIQSRGLDGGEVPFTRMEDMVEYYIGEIRKIQPVGPYLLGGYSFGGHIAYAMAQRLRDSGENVALLALLDSYSHSERRFVSVRTWLSHHRQKLSDLPFRHVPGYLWLRVTNFAQMAYLALMLGGYSAVWQYFESRGRPIPRILRRTIVANHLVRRGYQPLPYAGDATLFKAERYAWTHADQHEGWRELIKGRLEIRSIPGGHFEIMNPPYVEALAAELSDAIEQAQDSRPDATEVSAIAS